MFEAYLAEHGYERPAYEPDLGVPTRPDYLVRRGDAEVICEVEEFDAEKISLPWTQQRVGTTDMKTVLRPVREKIRAAARQLKPLADDSRPLVVVIANPGDAPVAMGERELIWAMYGDPTFTFTIDPETGGAVDDGQFIAGRHGKLRNDHPYLGAVAIVREREHAVDFYDRLRKGMDGRSADERLDAIFAARDRGEVPEGSYHRLDVFKCVSVAATPVPDDFFDGPNDRLFDFDEKLGAYRQVSGRLRLAGRAGGRPNRLTGAPATW